MTHPYDSSLRELAREAVKELKMESYVREGVYCHLSGPSYETPFESRFLKLIGCDSVGMSTAPEVVVAKHCGMTVLGMCICMQQLCDTLLPGNQHGCFFTVSTLY